jgi:hypothetical protein
MYRELEQSGHLEESLSLAEHHTSRALSELLDQGLDYQQAWESVREEWAFLPSEEDEPGRVFDLEQARRRLPLRPAAETTASPTPTPSGPALPGRKPAET